MSEEEKNICISRGVNIHKVCRDSKKDVVGIWGFENETRKFCLKVLTDL